MESVKGTLERYENPKSKSKLSQNSIEKVYMVKYKKLLKGLKGDGVVFLQNDKVVMKWLRENYGNIQTQKSFITAIITILNAHKLNSDMYVSHQKEITNIVNRIYSEHKRNAKQDENFVSIDELKSVIPFYEKAFNKATGKQKYDLMKKWIIAFIYVGDMKNPPFRLNYSCDIVKKADYEEYSRENYLVLKKGEPEFFHFGNHKTANKTGIKRIRVGDKLKEALKIWLKHNKSKEHLLLNDRGEKMSNHTLGVFISKVFEPLGKHITINDLRHIFISELLDIDYEMSKKRRLLAARMGHSIEVQETYHLN